jgi:two-component system LytT family response regulator
MAIMRAILIDDERSNLENLSVLLAKYCPLIKIIAQSQSVDEAVDLVNLQQPDLLFLDIQMGKHSGFDLLSGFLKSRLKLFLLQHMTTMAFRL